MLTVSTQIPTHVRGKVRALVKAHKAWHAYLDERGIISAQAKNRDLLEFAVQHPELSAKIEVLLAPAVDRPQEGQGSPLSVEELNALTLVERIEQALRDFAKGRTNGRKPVIRIKAVTA